MIAELVRQYDTLKRCGIRLPDPFFREMPVSLEIRLKSDGSFGEVDWICKPQEGDQQKKSSRKINEKPCLDIDCPVTERSSCRSSGNDSPHGLVDNPTWVFGELSSGKTEESRKYRGKVRRISFFLQLRQLIRSQDDLSELKIIWSSLVNLKTRNQIWNEVEKLLEKKIPLADHGKWRAKASKARIRWVVESIGSQGKPVHALVHVKKAWVVLQENHAEQKIISQLDGQPKSARVLHPRIKGASLISFNDPSTYCGHLHFGLALKEKEKPKTKGEVRKLKEEDKEENVSALFAQIGLEEAEKYSLALDWLVSNASVRFGDSTNCIWVDQSGDVSKELDKSAHELVGPQGKRSHFLRGKAKKDKGPTLADSGDLIEAMRRFRNAQRAGYRNKRFYLLSMLMRKKGRHAVLGGFSGTMDELENNANQFIKCSSICLPKGYFTFKDEPRDFCPTLMDILDAVGVKSQKKKKLVWDREVVEVIVRGRPMPPDLCRLVVLKAIQQKFQEQSKETCLNYRGLLAIAAGCSRYYLNRISGKEGYDMGLNTSITDPGYLAGRLFSVCENIQKRGRNWGATLSDKLFSAGIERPRDTLGQLYQNCLCYEIYKKDSEWFNEILDKVKLKEGAEGNSAVMPAQGVDAFEFLLGYWHQRCALKPVGNNSNDQKEEIQSNTERKET